METVSFFLRALIFGSLIPIKGRVVINQRSTSIKEYRLINAYLGP